MKVLAWIIAISLMAFLSFSIDSKVLKVKKSKPKKQKVEYYEAEPKVKEKKEVESEYELIENYKELLANKEGK